MTAQELLETRESYLLKRRRLLGKKNAMTPNTAPLQISSLASGLHNRNSGVSTPCPFLVVTTAIKSYPERKGAQQNKRAKF